MNRLEVKILICATIGALNAIFRIFNVDVILGATIGFLFIFWSLLDKFCKSVSDLEKKIEQAKRDATTCENDETVASPSTDIFRLEESIRMVDEKVDMGHKIMLMHDETNYELRNFMQHTFLEVAKQVHETAEKNMTLIATKLEAVHALARENEQNAFMLKVLAKRMNGRLDAIMERLEALEEKQ